MWKNRIFVSHTHKKVFGVNSSLCLRISLRIDEQGLSDVTDHHTVIKDGNYMKLLYDPNDKKADKNVQTTCKSWE